jgi:hypothetical protein
VSRHVHVNAVAEALKAEGFPLPDNCREARVVMGAGSALMIQYDVFLADDDLVRLGKALQKVGEKK